MLISLMPGASRGGRFPGELSFQAANDLVKRQRTQLIELSPTSNGVNSTLDYVTAPDTAR